MKELASGSRLEGSPRRAADKAISEQLRAEIRSTQALDQNAQTASSLVQVTEGGLNEQNNLLIRMRELAIQASTDTLTEKQRGYLDEEFQQLNQEVDRIAQSSRRTAAPSLAGDGGSFQYLMGTQNKSYNIIRYDARLNTTSSGLGIRGLEVADKSDALDSLESLDEALENVAGARAKLGAIQSRFDAASSHLQTQAVNLSDAHSRYSDASVAEAVTKLRSAQALQYYQASALRSAQDQQMSVLKLVG